MTILGLGGIMKDAACSVLKDGRIAAAIEENKIMARVDRRARCRSRPSRSA